MMLQSKFCPVAHRNDCKSHLGMEGSQCQPVPMSSKPVGDYLQQVAERAWGADTGPLSTQHKWMPILHSAHTVWLSVPLTVVGCSGKKETSRVRGKEGGRRC